MLIRPERWYFATALTLSSRKWFLYIIITPPVTAQRINGKCTDLLLLGDLGLLLSASLLLALALLQEGLRDEDLLLGGDGTASSIRLVRDPRYT